MDLCGGQTLRLSSPNSKILHLVRHAQGIHNVALEENGATPLSNKLFDAHLSTKGHHQVSERRKDILESGLLNTIELVITSPLSRAMQTSTGIFRGQEATNRFENFQKAHNFPPIVALEICRERMGLYPCDQRESISTYRSRFSDIDFTMIENDEDALWQAEERENLEEVSARGLQFVEWLWERPEKEIAVVSHGIFLQQTLCALHEKIGIPLEKRFLKRFANCEIRSICIPLEERFLKRFANCEIRSIPTVKSDMEADTITTYNCRKYVTPPSTSLHSLE